MNCFISSNALIVLLGRHGTENKLYYYNSHSLRTICGGASSRTIKARVASSGSCYSATGSTHWLLPSEKSMNEHTWIGVVNYRKHFGLVLHFFKIFNIYKNRYARKWATIGWNDFWYV